MAALVGCGDDGKEIRDFNATFEARVGTTPVTCDAVISGLGPAGQHQIGASDLRFYVSNIMLHDHDGGEHPLELDANEFQYTSAAGSVALIDLTGNTSGTCANSAIAFAEGTARTNNTITGTVLDGDFHGISFDVGVPQAVMKDVIATKSAEAAPSPLGEMTWGWAGGYRHLVFNFTVMAPGGEHGEGYLHIGSRDCGADGQNALEAQEECGRIYTPKVDVAFEEGNTIVFDIKPLLASLDFVSPIYDPMTFEQIGEGPGVECHSAPEGQPDCSPILQSLGLDVTTGVANPAANMAFETE
ncbi:MAG: MbnP family copper-binding protein [Kofleriaceae bacterium]